jgi:hypothetical protein
VGYLRCYYSAIEKNTTNDVLIDCNRHQITFKTQGLTRELNVRLWHKTDIQNVKSPAQRRSAIDWLKSPPKTDIAGSLSYFSMGRSWRHRMQRVEIFSIGDTFFSHCNSSQTFLNYTVGI